MTRKHFEAIAAALARTRPQDPVLSTPTDARPEWYQWSVTRDAIIGALAESNPAFDRPRFIRATEA